MEFFLGNSISDPTKKGMEPKLTAGKFPEGMINLLKIEL